MLAEAFPVTHYKQHPDLVRKSTRYVDSSIKALMSMLMVKNTLTLYTNQRDMARKDI